MMDESEIEVLAELLEARMHGNVVGHGRRRKHWPRRVALVCVALAGAGLIQYIVEDVGLRTFAHTGEMVLAALFEAIFTKAREFE
jgi:hypothetical protein